MGCPNDEILGVSKEVLIEQGRSRDAPSLSPISVIFEASPPKAWMFSSTHLTAARWPRMEKFVSFRPHEFGWAKMLMR